MKNIAALIVSIALLVAAGFGLSSCKEDEPPSPPKLSFAETEISVDEDDGNLEVELVLDKAHSKDLRIEYELGGTAKDQDVVGTANADYKVVGDHGTVEIPAGETSATIELEIYGDAAFEEDETIEIAIIDTNTDAIQLTDEDETIITIVNDDEQITASLAAATLTINEADELVGVVVQLDKPAHANLLITYTLEGTAIDSTRAYNHNSSLPPNSPEPRMRSDFYVNAPVTGELMIQQGETSGNIEIQAYSDFIWEPDETIELTLTGGDVTVGTASEMTITLKQQDGKIIALLWEGYDDVDMDLFLWIGDAPDNLTGWLATSLRAGVDPPEEVLIFPSKIMADAQIASLSYGLSYTYYSGTADPMTFEVQFADLAGGVIEAEASREIFTATYTTANINPWDTQSGVDPLIAQTFKIVDGNFADISTPITVYTADSRLKPGRLPKGFKRERATPGTLNFR